MKPLRLLLVRHGESFNNALMARPGMTFEKWSELRSVDPDLSQRGMQEAQALGHYLSKTMGKSRADVVLPLGALYVSPVKRAMQTLHPLAQKLGMKPKVWTDCFEVGGMWSEGGTENRGLTRTQMKDLFPTYELPEDVSEQGWYQLNGKETLEQACQRVAKTSDRLRAMASVSDRLNGTLLLLTHHDHIDLLLQALLMGAASRQHVFSHENTAMSCLDIFPDGQTRVLFINRMDHLPDKGGGQFLDLLSKL